MTKKIAIIRGDGIGPEVISQGLRVLNKIATIYNHNFEYLEVEMGACAIEKYNTPLPDKTLAVCKQVDAILFGAIGDPKYDNNPEAKIRPEQGLLKLRKSLNLFCNIRPTYIFPTIKSLSPLKESKLDNVDFIIYRELISGIYFGRKKSLLNFEAAVDMCYYHKDEILPIAHLAFKAAQIRKNKLCLIDKANVLETSRLWRRTVQELHSHYPEVELSFMFVDNAAMQILLNPSQFDIILTENMFGDILSDEASVLSGSLGLSPSASIGTHSALFEPIHGSYPQAAGKNIANPIGTILSVSLMLEYFNLFTEANLIKSAVQRTLNNHWYTADLKPKDYLKTTEITDRILENID